MLQYFLLKRDSFQMNPAGVSYVVDVSPYHSWKLEHPPQRRWRHRINKTGPLPPGSHMISLICRVSVSTPGMTTASWSLLCTLLSLVLALDEPILLTIEDWDERGKGTLHIAPGNPLRDRSPLGVWNDSSKPRFLVRLGVFHRRFGTLIRLRPVDLPNNTNGHHTRDSPRGYNRDSRRPSYEGRG